MENGVECYGFRCNLTIKDITIYNAELSDTKESRNELFREFFKMLKEKKTLENSYQKRKYILIFSEELNNIVHCKIARKREICINELNEGLITKKTEEDYPNVNIFVDLNGQKILIEINTSVFDNIDTCKKELENIMGNYFNKMDISFEIFPITEKSEFLNFFNDGKVYRVTFELNVPNWGNAENAAQELADDCKKIGADKLNLSLSNKDGNIVYGDELESFVRYVADGAGIWKVQGKYKDGNKYCVQSEEKKKKLIINTSKDKINQELDLIELELIKHTFNEIETIEELKMKYE